MTNQITIDVKGIPKGQPRPRAFSRGGTARVYDPGTAEGWKSCIAVAARSVLPDEPIASPVTLMISFRMPRPKSHYRTGKRASELKPSSPTEHTSKPDIDNLVKAVMDCLTQLRMWRDDTQVVLLTTSKRYVNDYEQPGARIVAKAQAWVEPANNLLPTNRLVGNETENMIHKRS